MKPQARICLRSLALSLALCFTTNRVQAADSSKTNLAGTWKVTTSSTNTHAPSSPQTLKLKIDGGTLTGTLSYNSGPVVNGKTPHSELPITEGKLKGNEISFNFSHPPAMGKGSNATQKYQGTISGDLIKGTVTTEWMGQSNTRTWEAQRLKE